MKKNHIEGDPESKTVTTTIVPKKWSAREIKALCDKIDPEMYVDGCEKEVIQFRATTEAVDREEDIVMAEGGDFKHYLSKNPAFLWAHDYSEKNIGSVLDVKVDRTDPAKLGLLMTVLFETVTQEGKDLHELCRRGFIRAVSIGYRAKRGGMRFPSEAERTVLGMGPYGVIYTAWDMIELSLCPVGMNQEALKVRSLNKKTIAMLKGEDHTTISDGDIDMHADDVKKAIADGLAESLPGIITAVKAAIEPVKPAEVLPAAPVIPETPPASPPESSKAFDALIAGNPHIYGQPEKKGMDAILDRLNSVKA